MPLNEKGEKILRAMKKEYGVQKGERIFYSSINSGRISNVERNSMQRPSHSKRTGK